MPDELVGWELFAMFSLRGEAEFRAKLADINRLIDDTSRKMSGLGGGVSGGTASAGIRGNFAPLGGGGPTAGIPGNFSNVSGDLRPNALLDDVFGITSGHVPIPFGGMAPSKDRVPPAVGGGGGSGGIKEFDKAIKDAAASTKRFGLHQAWILRAATSGGIPGMIGGGAGALASLIPGLGLGTTGGMLLGNFAGQMAGGLFQRVRHDNAPDVEMGNPGLALLRQQAQRDASAAAGRNYRDTYKEGTKMERLWGDFHARGGQTVGGAVGNLWDNITQASEFIYYKVLKMVQGIDSKPGAGVGLAPGPMGSQGFSSVGEAHNAIIKMSLRHGFGGGATTSGPGFWESTFGSPVSQAIIANQLSSAVVH